MPYCSSRFVHFPAVIISLGADVELVVIPEVTLVSILMAYSCLVVLRPMYDL